MSVGIGRLFLAGVVVLCVLVGWLVFSGAAALAAGPEAPTIVSESVANVEATAATLEAEINPGGVATTYHFEYGTSETYGQSTPESGSIGEDEAAHLLTVRVTGLEPGRTYHYRVVASNSQSPAGGTPGPGKTFTATAAPGSEPPQSCPNEQLRAEQPYGSRLPDCRAYELVSPAETGGGDAIDSFLAADSRAAMSGEALVFASRSSFASPAGSYYENQFLSRRTPDGWSTRSITPPYTAYGLEGGGPISAPFFALAFTPELSAGVTYTDELLTGEAPAGLWELYVDHFAGGDSYQWVSNVFTLGLLGKRYSPGSWALPMGTSTDLSHVVFEAFSAQERLYEWVAGESTPNLMGVANDGEPINANAGDGTVSPGIPGDNWHAVSSTGSRVFFTNEAGQLYVRENAERPQSPLAQPEAGGTGTLTVGSNTVTEVTSPVAASGLTNFTAGSPQVAVHTFGYPTFFVGESLAQSAYIPVGATIVKVSNDILTLSAPAIASGEEVPISSAPPPPFRAGQKISGHGIPRGTTITAVTPGEPGELTLSAPSTFSGGGVALTAGGGCTVSTDACTVEVSASQRKTEDPAGPQPARYWGASADGSKVFFTSSSELTEDAYTGLADNAANLYEYDLETGKLTDLTGEAIDKTGSGAAVQSVVQISEEGQYVYFVADGKLAEGAVEGEPNLYVSHEGTLAFVANGAGLGEYGPEFSNAVLTPDGKRLAFTSALELTGYDNHDANTSDPDSEIYLYNTETNGLACASCDPSGARPVGSSSLPGPTSVSEAEYRPRDLTESGTLFFDSSDALVPHASDGRQNVYEYEHGHVYPISDVAGASESFFLDAGASGNDVFFATAEHLVAQSQGNRVAVYDARIDGGFPASASPAACANGDSCKPPPTPQPPIFGAPSSATFTGPGNIAPPPPVVVKKATTKKPVKCKKAKTKNKKGKCVPKKKKKAKAKKSAHTDRRTH